jgi:hypothetical protein
MAEQTAVEWIIKQLYEYIRKSAHNELSTIRTGEFRIGLRKAIDFCEQAKEMEKEQHGVTWDSAIKAHDNRGHVHARSIVDFDEYYNETYKTQAQ